MLNIRETIQKMSVYQGFTLIEIVITIVITAIALTMFASIYSTTQRQSVSPVIQIKSAELAQAFVEEIYLKRFDENSPVGNEFRCDEVGQIACSGPFVPDAGETRATFDDVDDFHGFNQSVLQDSQGNNLNGFTGYNVSVSVAYAGADQGFGVRLLKKIEITITSPENDQFIFSAYKGNF